MLYVSGIVLAFFLTFLLLTKKNKTIADKILVAWLFFTGLNLLTFYLFLTEQYLYYPSFVTIGFALPLLHSQFLYLYTRQQTTARPFDAKQWLHFLPAVLFSLLFADFYFLPFERQVEIFKAAGKGYESRMFANLIAVSLSGVIYVPLALYRLLRYKQKIVHQFSNTEKINFNWLLHLIIWMGVIWVAVLFVREGTLIFGAVALFVIWLGYFGIKQVHVFGQNNSPMQDQIHAVEKPAVVLSPENEINIEEELSAAAENILPAKYQKSSLGDAEAEMIHQKLKNYFREKKPHTNPDLTLDELAESLAVHPNYLSQVINSKEKKNFYELINEKRIEEFINLTSDPANNQFTLLALAYDCGFNSKASFNRNFKKHTGLTPSEYLKRKAAS